MFTGTTRFYVLVEETAMRITSLSLIGLAALATMALCAGPSMASDHTAGLSNAAAPSYAYGPGGSESIWSGIMPQRNARNPNMLYDDGAGIGMIRVITHDNAFDDMMMIATDSVPALSAFNVATTCLYDENPSPVTQMMIPGLIGWSGASGHPTASCLFGDSSLKLKLKIGPET